MRVCEAFLSIQGESSYAGLPSFFIRLSECNLRCIYCDTTYAYHEGYERSLEELIEDARESAVNLVTITGGEPLLQSAVLKLISELCDDGFTVLIETNGSIAIDGLDERAVVILDIKTPGSGESDKNKLENLGKLGQRGEIKFVLTDRDDYLWSRDIVDKYSLDGRKVIFSPAAGVLNAELLAGWIMEDRLNVRLGLQLHRFIFGDRRGV